ncbi:DMT family transporter, partial [Candidatus Woesearchaeota archaeon]|nr:DMT family transporter [Candidatus Woesearchaeota archaeon]
MAEWYMLALYAAVFSTFSTLVHKKILYKEHAMEFVTVTALFNFLFAFAFLFKADFNFNYKILYLIFLVALIDSVALIFLFKAFRHLEISVASPLMGFEPGFIVLLSFLFLKEGITYLQTWGLVLIIFGGYLIEIKRDSFSFLQPIKDAVKSKYIHYSLFAILLYGIGAVLTRYIVNPVKGFGINPYTYAFLIYGLNAFILFFILSIIYDGIQGVKNGIKTIGWWTIPSSLLFVAHGFLGLLAISKPEANVGLVIAIKRISIFFETFL